MQGRLRLGLIDGIRRAAQHVHRLIIHAETIELIDENRGKLRIRGRSTRRQTQPVGGGTRIKLLPRCSGIRIRRQFGDFERKRLEHLKSRVDRSIGQLVLRVDAQLLGQPNDLGSRFAQLPHRGQSLHLRGEIGRHLLQKPIQRVLALRPVFHPGIRQRQYAKRDRIFAVQMFEQLFGGLFRLGVVPDLHIERHQLPTRIILFGIDA